MENENSVENDVALAGLKLGNLKGCLYMRRPELDGNGLVSST
jgi:hypothetical protein